MWIKINFRNRFLRKHFFGLAILLLVASCKPESIGPKDVLTIKGSDTMVNLTARWAESYMSINPRISIHVSGGGSFAGIAALFNNSIQIADISRELSEREIDEFEKLNCLPELTRVAIDCVVIITHPSNPVDSLTFSQIKNIYSGNITDWQQLSGIQSSITLYGRENSSGTAEFLKKNVLNLGNDAGTTNFFSNMLKLQGTAAIAEAVASDKNGIGFGGIGYFINRTDIKIIKIKKSDQDKTANCFENHKINFNLIRQGKYPLTRNLYMATTNESKQNVRNFLDFVTSDNGQKIVAEMGFLPLEF